MKSLYIVIVFFLLSINFSHAQTAPKREMRGAWIATHFNIDWPSTTSTSAQEQSSFIQRLDEHKATGMNAIFTQVRSQCDALYPSPNEPWSAVLSGTQGVAPNPYYDPLLFMINETKQRGMEFHAWFNPYRALVGFTTTSYNNLAATHVAKLHPDWTMTVTNIASPFTKQLILNPGAPEVWEHIIGSIMHVVRNYDVDGIHFDDYFYTSLGSTTYNDDSVYNIHNRGISNRADWRRSNVDTLIKRLNDSIKSVKPWIKFGISPTGIWMSAPTDPAGSNTSTGAIQHKKDLYANSRLWLQLGWIDYLAPQVYWFNGQAGSDYTILAPWWSNNNLGRHIYIGQAGYKVGESSPASNGAFITDPTQIPTQLRLNRSLSGIKGQIIYHTTSLRNNRLGFRDSLKLNFYNKPALLPTMSWKDNIAPNPASNLTAAILPNNTVSLSWANPSGAATEMDVVKRFAIYKGVNTMPDINNPDHLIAITNTDVSSFIDTALLPANTTYNYVVTAIDRLYNESVESNTASVAAGPLPLNLISFDVQKTTNNNALIKWETANEINTHYFDVERAFDNNNFKKILSINANDGSVTYNYNATDYNLKQNGTYYYRLKMVDKDAAFTISSIKKITFNNAVKELSVYPNPITKGNKLQLQWPNVNGNIIYHLMQANGKTVIQGNIQFYGGVANIRLSNNLAVGNYILQCYKDGKTHSVKIVVQ